MSASPRPISLLYIAATLGVMLAWSAGGAQAQYKNDFDTFMPDVADYQWFEPVDLDLNRQPANTSSGYFFRYDKIVWALTSERVEVGDPNEVVLSEQFRLDNSVIAQNEAAEFPELLIDDMLPQAPMQHLIQNGIQDAPPYSEFGYADRYEMGFVDDDGRGVMLGVIMGNEIDSERTYGFGAPNGFGSVFVNFRTPPDYLLGFTDIATEAFALDDDINVGADNDDGAGVNFVILGPDGNVTIDGIIDDNSFNGGTFFIIDANGDGVFTLGIDPFFVDFGDAREFNIRFNTLTVRNVTQMNGVELMRTHVMNTRHWLQKRQNESLEFGYGVRFFQMKDAFAIDGVGDFLGDTFIDTEAENQIVGPQLSVKWQKQRGPLNFGVDGRVLFGYNVGDLSQEYGIGAGLVPNRVNNPIIAQPTSGSNGRQENTFSPLVEFRAEANYQLTRALSANVGYTATYIDNITRASQIVDYTLPNVGLTSGGDQQVFVNGVHFGLEFWH